jgi:glyoxylase-like metal-dependent hydrolase (beta-lactamase superfamily II)
VAAVATDDAPRYEVFALRYAMNTAYLRGRSFIRADVHDAPMPLAYYIWAIRGAGRVIVVDMGFSRSSAERRGRDFIVHPVDALARIGIDAATVTDVIVTHLHYDHAGNFEAFPRATFHLQDAELAFATGRCMCHPVMQPAFDLEDILTTVRHVWAGRVRFHDGDGRVAPGVTVHLVRGHSAGLQIVRVLTARGWLVLASDATHFYANIERRHPFSAGVDLPNQFEGYRRCEELADSPDHIVPGHDPLVMERYPAVAGAADIVRLDLPPLTTQARQPATP